MQTHEHLPALYTPMSRRRMLRTAAGATAGGLAGILLSKTPPLYAATRTVTMLTWNHFVAASDEYLRKMAKDFEKENKCQVKIDFIPHRDTYVKVAKEQETREGHDITFLFFSKPQLHHDDLETLGFMDDLGKKLGGWYDLIREVDQVDGRWVAMPFFYSCMPMTYREDLYQQAGLQAPKTWEEWKDSGKKLKEATGKKVGIALSQTEDANISLYAILWTYGASTADKERRVSINSPETRKAMEYMKELYQTTMTDEVLSWDDASNNQAFLGGEYSWVHNAVSIYFVAKEKVPDIFKVTNHTLTPHGPGGQHGTAIPFNYGVWKFAKEKELAMQFLQYMMEPKRYEEIFHATLAFNAPPFKNGEQFDWNRDPKTAILKDYAKTAHMIGWPAPPDRKAEQMRSEWIVPNMFTYYCTGRKSLDEAISWGEAELQRIYSAKA
jgi:multiple sugar transport system substrate-binding protein